MKTSWHPGVPIGVRKAYGNKSQQITAKNSSKFDEGISPHIHYSQQTPNKLTATTTKHKQKFSRAHYNQFGSK